MKACEMVRQLVHKTGAGHHAAFEALAQAHGDMGAAVPALTCAPELSAAAACTESPASEPPAPRVQGHENDGDRSDNDGSDNDGSASAASNAIPQDMMSALMQLMQGV